MSKNIKKLALVVTPQDIKESIYNIRGQQVMIDEDLAQMYEVTVKRLNEQVKRNIDRFPEKFRFQLTAEEYEYLKFQFGTSSENSLKSQNATSSSHGGRRTRPYVFTEQGVSMLSAVLRSETAVKISIQIMDAFVEMRKFIATNALLFQRLDKVEQNKLQQMKNLNNYLKHWKIKALHQSKEYSITDKSLMHIH